MSAQAAPAAAPAPLSLAKVQALISSASHGRAVAQSVFAGPGGLTGAVVSYKDAPNAPPSVIWVNDDASALLVGKLIGPKGEDLDKQAAQKVGLLLAPDKALAAAALPATNAIMVGSKGPVLTVFIDPNCIFCHMLYQQLEPLVAKGALRARYVLVAVVKRSSFAKAAAILSAKNPAAALQQDQAAFDPKTEEGGIKPDSAPSKAVTDRIGANNALMSKAGGDGTPMLLFCSKDGSVQQLEGMPRDVDTLLAELASGPAPACGG
ncbi:thiol:disulfide interchange protein DsbG [Metallibacterium sp.]|uniref:thiol:disulfide interchange protein DsbG n=1 Tax=Metallibacterium sp. TaxID=2940281 RepID=UPI00260E07B6|nr:thiol:disulfide interchange protein DsbG [Metallibacterium sp.]